MPFFSILVFFLQLQVEPGPGRPKPDMAVHAKGIMVVVGMTECCATEAWPAAEKHLIREFRALGFSVFGISGKAVGERSQREELLQLAGQNDAAGAVRIVRSPDSAGYVELWVHDQITGKTMFRRMPISPEQTDADAEIAALRVVETLRAGLLELSLMKPKERPKLPESVRRLAGETQKPASLDLQARLQGGLWASAGQVPMTGILQIGTRWTWRQRLSLTAEIGMFPVSPVVESGPAAGTLDRYAALFWIGWVTSPARQVRFSLGFGAGAAWVVATGIRAGDGWRTRVDDTWLGLLGVQADLAWNLGPSYGLTFGMRTGVSIPRLSVRFGDVEVAGAGRPDGELLLGLFFRFK